MKRLLGILGVAIFTIMMMDIATLAADEEACVLLRNQTEYKLHFYIDEKFMCDAAERGYCAACHITIGKHTFKVTFDGSRPGNTFAVDVEKKFILWTVTD